MTSHYMLVGHFSGQAKPAIIQGGAAVRGPQLKGCGVIKLDGEAVGCGQNVCLGGRKKKQLLPNL